MIDLSRLKTLIEQLQHQAEEADRLRGEAQRPLFDQQLFRHRSKLLAPCVTEIAQELATLQKEQQAGRLLPERTQHLCEKLIAQINAIQRELATQHIRKNEPKQAAKWQRSINDVYQDLNKHKDWERRLKLMLREKESLLSRCSSQFEQQQSQKEILALEGRISRCQAALITLENEINRRERKG
ncbi:primosomal replication protein [Photobacterium carnosum]|uniref:Prepilin peptidase n=1 Tax=Photobacterium carnosum TaxID=2023717 RepID=A0A2N4UXL8_9GAMM|nr:primosomal replication protein [Photobacterium carnosum]MBY3787195.1 primosomal replication protein [Photobacterium carnosum]MCD9532598.1 prepilin peptidase [Photobacterium carnosum]MCD9540043.1 prepilin peptidase [Photobacterium carnosum]MCD9543791.1 prepilin peptidase [Photobacterium carnosum]MCD9557199.1 primosomal replication protein [Photobacterium carnosum]